MNSTPRADSSGSLTTSPTIVMDRRLSAGTPEAGRSAASTLTTPTSRTTARTPGQGETPPSFKRYARIAAAREKDTRAGTYTSASSPTRSPAIQAPMKTTAHMGSTSSIYRGPEDAAPHLHTPIPYLTRRARQRQRPPSLDAGSSRRYIGLRPGGYLGLSCTTRRCRADAGAERGGHPPVRR